MIDNKTATGFVKIFAIEIDQSTTDKSYIT